MRQKLTLSVRMHELAEDDKFMEKTWGEIAEVISRVPGVDLEGFEL